METYQTVIDAVNGVIWHNIVLYVVLGVGVLFTLWSGFCQYRALTHGTQVIRGKYDDPNDPGAINHFQALSAALSATVGLGNIGGVALAIALGGPGAVFWMWMVGIFGMALKTTEVCLSMIYRNTDDPDNPHGGPMWVAKRGFEQWRLGGIGTVIGGIFCITLLISAITGGNMFQSWNVADITKTYFDVPQIVTGIILAVIVASVIIGGIKRIGSVAGMLVPIMCVLYLLAGCYVIIVKIGVIPDVLLLIVQSAFNPVEAQGAFIGGTFGYAFLWGMKRALFSSEAGQGSSPIAHSAAKTDEPVREAVVAGLEPFIDTIVVCTLTALVILSSGIWNREADVLLTSPPAITQAADKVDSSGQATAHVWSLEDTIITEDMVDSDWQSKAKIVIAAHASEQTGNNLQTVDGDVITEKRGDRVVPVRIEWSDVELPLEFTDPPTFDFGEINTEVGAIYMDYKGASLTAKAFDRVNDGLGKWLVTLAAWLFAISTMISWSYYGEQGMIYLAGEKSVLPYKIIYCLVIIVAALPIITTDKQLDDLTALGTGVMLWANIPIMLIFGTLAMRTYHSYIGKLKRGELDPHDAPSVTDVVGGRDVKK